MSRRLIRDDVRGGAFLNKKLICSPTDYRHAQCYYYGDPIQLCIAYFDFGHIHSPKGEGYQAEFAIATDGFTFDRSIIKQGLAIFFENGRFNNIRLQALISPRNRQAVRLAKAAGFTLEGELRNVSPDGNRLIYSLLKEEFNGRYSKHTQTTPSTIGSGDSGSATSLPVRAAR